MILLERLTAESLGPLDLVDLEFAPRGRHAIRAADNEASALWQALLLALFGNGRDGEVDPAGGHVELTLVAAGQRYTIGRSFEPWGGERAVLSYASGGTLQEVHGSVRIRRVLEPVLNLDRTTYESLTHQTDSIEIPPARELATFVRALLGERRMTALDASFAAMPEFAVSEERARTRLQLAQAAGSLTQQQREVLALEREARHARVQRAVAAVEHAERTLRRASAAANEADRQRLRLHGIGATARRHTDLAALWRQHRAAAQDAQVAAAERASIDRELGRVSSDEEALGAAETRLAALDRSLRAAARAREAADLADTARAERDRQRARAAEVDETRAKLDAARRRLQELDAAAERAETLARRADEEASLPAAHRLWGAWLALGDVGSEADRADLADERARTELERTEHQLRRLSYEAERRRSQITGAGAAAVVSTILLGLGLLAVPALAPIGIAGGIGSVAVAGWLQRRGQHARALEPDLLSRVAEIDVELAATDRAATRARAALRQRAAIEQELHALGLEIPPTIDRADTLHRSAAARLRIMADGDERVSAQRTAGALDESRAAAADGRRTTQRLHARLRSLAESQPEVLAAAAEAEHRVQLKHASEHRAEASALAREAGLTAATSDIRGARSRAATTVARLRSQLRAGPRLQLRRHAVEASEHEIARRALKVSAQIDRMRGEHPDLPEHSPPADIAERWAARAALIETLAALGLARAGVDRRAAESDVQRSEAASSRGRIDLAAAMRAAGLTVEAAPTIAEARAAFPDLDEIAHTPSEQRLRRLRRSRASVEKLEREVRRLELRSGESRETIDTASATGALDEIVRKRRRRAYAATIADAALQAVGAAAPAAVETWLRAVVGVVTGGRHWDVRVGPAFELEAWDEDRAAWVPDRAFTEPIGAALRLALRVAVAAVAAPSDSAELPAFLWFDHGASAGGWRAAMPLVEALARPGFDHRFPQIVVVGDEDFGTPLLFDHAATIRQGRTVRDRASPALKEAG